MQNNNRYSMECRVYNNQFTKLKFVIYIWFIIKVFRLIKFMHDGKKEKRGARRGTHMADGWYSLEEKGRDSGVTTLIRLYCLPFMNKELFLLFGYS